MQYIFLEYSIDCAHFLPYVETGHKCGNMHGHRYDIRIEITGTIGVQGWIVDYADVKTLFDPVVLKLDHRTLNELPGLSNPTCENIVQYLVRELPAVADGRLTSIEMRVQDIRLRDEERYQ